MGQGSSTPAGSTSVDQETALQKEHVEALQAQKAEHAAALQAQQKEHVEELKSTKSEAMRDITSVKVEASCREQRLAATLLQLTDKVRLLEEAKVSSNKQIATTQGGEKALQERSQDIPSQKETTPTLIFGDLEGNLLAFARTAVNSINLIDPANKNTALQEHKKALEQTIDTLYQSQEKQKTTRQELQLQEVAIKDQAAKILQGAWRRKFTKVDANTQQLDASNYKQLEARRERPTIAAIKSGKAAWDEKLKAYLDANKEAYALRQILKVKLTNALIDIMEAGYNVVFLGDLNDKGHSDAAIIKIVTDLDLRKKSRVKRSVCESNRGGNVARLLVESGKSEFEKEITALQRLDDLNLIATLPSGPNRLEFARTHGTPLCWIDPNKRWFIIEVLLREGVIFEDDITKMTVADLKCEVAKIRTKLLDEKLEAYHLFWVHHHTRGAPDVEQNTRENMVAEHDINPDDDITIESVAEHYRENTLYPALKLSLRAHFMHACGHSIFHHGSRVSDFDNLRHNLRDIIGVPILELVCAEAKKEILQSIEPETFPSDSKVLADLVLMRTLDLIKQWVYFKLDRNNILGERPENNVFTSLDKLRAPENGAFKLFELIQSLFLPGTYGHDGPVTGSNAEEQDIMADAEEKQGLRQVIASTGGDVRVTVVGHTPSHAPWCRRLSRDPDNGDKTLDNWKENLGPLILSADQSMIAQDGESTSAIYQDKQGQLHVFAKVKVDHGNEIYCVEIDPANPLHGLSFDLGNYAPGEQKNALAAFLNHDIKSPKPGSPYYIRNKIKGLSFQGYDPVQKRYVFFCQTGRKDNFEFRKAKLTEDEMAQLIDAAKDVFPGIEICYKQIKQNAQDNQPKSLEDVFEPKNLATRLRLDKLFPASSHNILRHRLVKEFSSLGLIPVRPATGFADFFTRRQPLKRESMVTQSVKPFLSLAEVARSSLRTRSDSLPSSTAVSPASTPRGQDGVTGSPLSPKDRGGGEVGSLGDKVAMIVYGNGKPGTDREDAALKR